MAEKIEKGQRVTIAAGKDTGTEGVVFWSGKSKFGPGLRYGIRGDDGETYWASGEQVEPSEGSGAGSDSAKRAKKAKKAGAKRVKKSDPEQENRAAKPSRAGKKPASFKRSTAVAAIKRLLKGQDDNKLQRAIADIPKPQRASFLWAYVGHGKLEDHWALLEATGALAPEVPLSDLTTALLARSEKSEAELVPGVGDRVLTLLEYMDLADDSYLHRHEAELPESLRQAFWLARGKRGIEGASAPAQVLDAMTAALPGHALSGKMAGHELGQVINWMNIPQGAIQESTFELLEKSRQRVALPALGCPLFALPHEDFMGLARRLDILHLEASYLTWWLARRKEALPDEGLDEHTEVFAALVAAMPGRAKKARGKKGTKTGKKKSAMRNTNNDKFVEQRRWWMEEALEAGALCLARWHLEAEVPVPAVLLERFTRHTENLTPWQPVFESLDMKARKKVYRLLQSLLDEYRKPRLTPLRILIDGEDSIPSMIRQLEDGVRTANSVSSSHLFTPVGWIGRPAVAPLATRIDQLTAKLDPKAPPGSTGYEPRRVVIALRNALAVALARTAEAGEPIDKRFDAYLAPTPRTLFAGNDDFPYCFFTGLSEAQGLFAALPKARVQAWIQGWRRSGVSSYLEERLEMALPENRHGLLRGGPTLAQQIAEQAEQSGLECSQNIYLLTTEPKGKKGRKADKGPMRSPYNRVGGEPKGLPKTRWPGDGAERYQPVLSLDLECVPELRRHYSGARAICLFVDRPEEGFEDSAVVALSEAACKRGFRGGEGFVVERVAVPPEVFALDRPRKELESLRARIAEAEARVLGRPFFIQQSPSAGDEDGFVLEAGEYFTGLNLGDSGRLYVYTREAFWECH